MADTEYVGTSTPDGTIIGKAADKLAFYAGTPAAQIAVGTAATTAPTSTSPYGFTSAQATTILNTAIALQTIGLFKSA